MTHTKSSFALVPSGTRHVLHTRRCPRVRRAQSTALVKSGRWTAAEQNRFVKLLTETDTVDAAARAVGRSRSSALAERARDRLFASAWDQALDPRVVHLETLLLDRTLSRLDPVMAIGKLSNTEMRHDAALGMWFLENRLPHRYGKSRLATAEGGMDGRAPAPANPAADQAKVDALIAAAEQRMQEAEAFLREDPEQD